MTASPRYASSFTAIAIGIVAAIGAAAASPSWAATGRSANASETGRQTDLVNRPGCWTESGYDGRFPCELAGGH